MEKQNMMMKELPVSDRPYEKCLTYGAETLRDEELLSVILRCGSNGESALTLADRLLREVGGLTGFYHRTAAELMSVRGIGKVKAVQLKCITELSARIAREKAVPDLCFTDPASIAAYYMEQMRHMEQEHVILLMLGTKGNLLGEQTLSIGTIDQAMIAPRDVFKTAMASRAASIVLLHNHPSGDPTPSEEDILLTECIRQSGEILGVDLLDHIIIGDQKAVSFRNEGLL